MRTDIAAVPDAPRYAGELGSDHPGFTDAAYRRRREVIAEIAARHRPGEPIPHAPYADAEHGVWQRVVTALAAKHREIVPAELVEASQRLALPVDHVPQLDEVGALLSGLTRFAYRPVAGLVAPKAFYSSLGERAFQSTQYIRHASAPFYTPEPDVIHEVAGHGIHLASDRFAAMYVAFGRRVATLASDDAVAFLSRFFWHTMEFGLVRERGEVVPYGAGLLSSVGELDAFRANEHRAWDIVAMGTRSYDITRYQDVLFVAESLDHLEDAWYGLVDDFDDDTPARLVHDVAVA